MCTNVSEMRVFVGGTIASLGLRETILKTTCLEGLAAC